tara:strand:- start:324 stop:686 length:363 start_codon:yes stop_codon:yes gene_type:complete
MNKIREGQQRRQDKFVSKVVNAQDAHLDNVARTSEGKRPSKKWGRMVAKAGRNERFRNKLNKVLTDDYDKGKGSGTYNDPYSGGDIGSHLAFTDPIIVDKKTKKKKTKKKDSNRKVPVRI